MDNLSFGDVCSCNTSSGKFLFVCSLAVAAGPELLIVGNRIPKTFMPKSSSLAGQAVAKGIVCHDVRASNRFVLLINPDFETCCDTGPLTIHIALLMTCLTAICLPHMS